MSKMLQIRNVPEEVHRRIKARAALAGMSMSDWMLEELTRSLERPTRAELLARIAGREPVAVDPPPAVAVRMERDAR